MYLMNGVSVLMRDGALLAADVCLPNTTGAWPVILLRTPYGRNNVGMDKLYRDRQRFLDAGYALMFQDCRGTGESEGTLRLNGENEHEDGYDTVEWAAAQMWCNGRVGMYGLSYFGFTQLAAAAQTPPHLRAICPFMTVSMEPFGAGRMHTTNTYHLAWAYGQLIREPLKHLPDDETRETLLPLLTRNFGRIAEWSMTLPMDENPAALTQVPLLNDYVRLQRGIEDRAFWASLRLPLDYDAVSVPVFFGTGWPDVACCSTIDGYLAARRSANAVVRDNACLLIGPWDHGGEMSSAPEGISFGEANSGEAQDVDGMMLRFFNRYLMGRDERPFAERVRYFVTGDNAWRGAADWPPESAEWRLYLAPSGDLADAPCAAVCEEGYLYDPLQPAPSEIAREQGAAADWSDISKRADVLYYRTPPLRDKRTVAGEIILSLRAATDARDTDFVCRLIDEDESGRQTALTAGLVRARHRNGLFSNDPVAPNTMMTYRLSAGHTAHAFLPGHRICIQVTSAMFPKHNRNLNTGKPSATTSDTAIAKQRVLLGGEDGSYLLLPALSK